MLPDAIDVGPSAAAISFSECRPASEFVVPQDARTTPPEPRPDGSRGGRAGRGHPLNRASAPRCSAPAQPGSHADIGTSGPTQQPPSAASMRAATSSAPIPGWSARRDHHEVRCRSPHDDVEAHPERRCRPFTPFEIDHDRRVGRRHGLEGSPRHRARARPPCRRPANRETSASTRSINVVPPISPRYFDPVNPDPGSFARTTATVRGTGPPSRDR